MRLPVYVEAPHTLLMLKGLVRPSAHSLHNLRGPQETLWLPARKETARIVSVEERLVQLPLHNQGFAGPAPDAHHMP